MVSGHIIEESRLIKHHEGHAIHTVSIDGIVHPMGYRVVREDMSSLGLRHNLNTLVYPFREWLHLPDEQLHDGAQDWGGIWVARTQSGAQTLKDYMLTENTQHPPIQTRIFKAALDSILYGNSYRIKTSGIFLYEELLP